MIDGFAALLLIAAAFYSGYHIGFEEMRLKCIVILSKAGKPDEESETTIAAGRG